MSKPLNSFTKDSFRADMKRRVYFVFDKELLEISKNITNIRKRAYVVHSLIASYNLLSKCQVIEGESATDEDLLSFHSADYISYLQKAQGSADLEVLEDIDSEYFNLGYDCPIFEKIYDFAKIIAGSSLSAAKKLVPQTVIDNALPIRYYYRGSNNIQPKSYLKFKYEYITDEKKDGDIFELPTNLSIDENIKFDLKENIMCKVREPVPVSKDMNHPMKCSNIGTDIQHVAINWFGGWHHAQRDAAEGFCYVNDIVIAIQFLLKSFKRILYVDLDIHHGNGIENAYLFSSRVFSLSLHKYEAGFYPASGSLNDTGLGGGKFFTVNVPLKDGITDDMYVEVFTKITQKVLDKYKPECIVVQCGADSLSGDPLGGFNLTPVGLGNCLKLLLSEKLPTLILGGGGYNIPNAARCWAYLTSIVLNYPLSNDIPENPYFNFFGPGFELDVTPTLRRNENTEEYLQTVVKTILQNLEALPDVL